jgi:pimeloyl-ACP methyl ester carboxylesterase
MSALTIRRGFADVPHGQMHYRYAGEGGVGGVPLLVIHASPGSSRQQVGLITSFAPHMRVLAPDTPGNGDSPALGTPEVSVPRMAAAYLAFLDAVGVDQVNLYGSHTGAAVAAELAIAAPGRVRAVVLDGISIMSADELADVLTHYAHPFDPDLDGAYLQRIFQFCRDQYLFFPWYKRDKAHQRIGGLPAPADLHAWVLEVMKGCQSYHLNYRAAFQWDALARLPQVASPALVIAGENDPLIDGTKAAAQALPAPAFTQLPRFDAPDFVAQRLATMLAFYREVRP